MNKPLKKLCLASGVALAFGAQADTFNVTATVDNAITLTETTPFTIGSVFIQSDQGTGTVTVATMTIDADGATSTTASSSTNTDATSQIVALGGASTGLLSISGAAPFTAITVTPALNTNMTHSSGSPTVPDIEITDIDVFDATDTSVTAAAVAATTMSVTTDASGAADIIVGGTFSAEASANAYEDGTYTGTYDVDVSY